MPTESGLHVTFPLSRSFVSSEVFSFFPQDEGGLRALKLFFLHIDLYYKDVLSVRLADQTGDKCETSTSTSCTSHLFSQKTKKTQFFVHVDRSAVSAETRCVPPSV